MPFQNDEELCEFIRQTVGDESASRITIIDGFAKSACFLTEYPDGEGLRIIYDENGIIAQLIEENGMNWSEAIEFYEYNIVRGLD